MEEHTPEEYTEEYTPTEQEENPRKKKEKTATVIMLVIATAMLLSSVAIICLRHLEKSGPKGFNSPEKAVQADLESSSRKEWKKIIERTTDEELEVILSIDAESVEKLGISDVTGLRKWVMANVENIPDPMNGKQILSYKTGKTEKFSPTDYLQTYLGGDTERNAYYAFLKSMDEIAVVRVEYQDQDGKEKRDRTTDAVTYKTEGKWHTVIGIQVIHSMLE